MKNDIDVEQFSIPLFCYWDSSVYIPCLYSPSLSSAVQIKFTVLWCSSLTRFWVLLLLLSVCTIAFLGSLRCLKTFLWTAPADKENSVQQDEKNRRLRTTDRPLITRVRCDFVTGCDKLFSCETKIIEMRSTVRRKKKLTSGKFHNVLIIFNFFPISLVCKCMFSCMMLWFF